MGRKLADIRYGQKQIQPAAEKCKYPHAAPEFSGQFWVGWLGFHEALIGNRAEGGSGLPYKILAHCCAIFLCYPDFEIDDWHRNLDYIFITRLGDDKLAKKGRYQTMVAEGTNLEGDSFAVLSDHLC